MKTIVIIDLIILILLFHVRVEFRVGFGEDKFGYAGSALERGRRKVLLRGLGWNRGGSSSSGRRPVVVVGRV